MADAVAGPRASASPVRPSTSQRSSGANGTNHAVGTDQVLAWMNTRSEAACPCHRAKSRRAASAWPAANAVASRGRASARSRESASHERSRVCHGQM